MRRLILASVIGGLFALALVASSLVLMLALSGGAGPEVPERAVLVLDLSQPIADAPPGNDVLGHALERALGGGVASARLDELVRALDHASTDNRVAAILIIGDVAQTGLHSSWPALHELRTALETVRAAGKPVIAHPFFWGEPELFVGSVADEAWIDPLGALRIDGFAFERLHFAGALEQLGIEVQIGRVGRFKSAVEPYVQRHMSDEARAQLEDLLAAQTKLFHETVSGARPIEATALRELEQAAPILDARAAIERGLVDRIVAMDEADAQLARVCGEPEDWTPERMDLAAYAAAVLPAPTSDGGRIAVLFAEGTILGGVGSGDVYGDTLAELVDEVRLDEGVAAVVLRINSPGGSVDGSERIRRALERLAEEKPLVVSMGALAASGGYWIACPAHEIIAHPNTITGSIGVFALLPNVEQLAERVGLDVHLVLSAEHAGAESLFVQKSEAQLAALQGHVERLYEFFLERVSTARGLSLEAVVALADGRVWSGERALELGLVDGLGGLDDAFAAAARRANLSGELALDFPQVGEQPFLVQLIDGIAHVAAPRSAEVHDAAKLFSELDPLRRAALELLATTDSMGATAHMPFELRLR